MKILSSNQGIKVLGEMTVSLSKTIRPAIKLLRKSVTNLVLGNLVLTKVEGQVPRSFKKITLKRMLSTSPSNCSPTRESSDPLLLFIQS